MPNPYLQQQANDISTNLTQNWQQNALPSINSGAQLAGGFGGSRQGVAQGISANGLNQAIGQAQTGLYSNAYQTDQQIAAQQAMQQAQLASQERMNQANLGLGYTQAGNNYSLGLGQLGLGQQQTNNNYSLGLGQLGLGFTQAGNNYSLGLGQLGLGQQQANTSQYNAETNRGLGYGQLQQTGEQNNFNNQLAGSNFQLNALNALQGWNNNGINWANQQQQIPLQNLGQLAGIGASIGGQGGSVSQPGASTIGSALAGGLTLAQLYQLLNRGG